jgi:hypothetical protein
MRWIIAVHSLCVDARESVLIHFSEMANAKRRGRFAFMRRASRMIAQAFVGSSCNAQHSAMFRGMRACAVAAAFTSINFHPVPVLLDRFTGRGGREFQYSRRYT